VRCRPSLVKRFFAVQVSRPWCASILLGGANALGPWRDSPWRVLDAQKCVLRCSGGPRPPGVTCSPRDESVQLAEKSSLPVRIGILRLPSFQ
jgi:hypothetical protein